MSKSRQKQPASSDELARITQRGFEAVDEPFDAVRRSIMRLESKDDLRESEERLLFAIKGIDIRRPGFEALVDDVKELARRVNALENKT
jgi:polyhydroxyalkanoate synthesis regulator phasin